MIDLSVIIVNFNVKEFLQNLLGSIQKSTGNISTEVIVIDNASDDGSVEILREKFPWVKLIASEKNLGFGRANNLGLEISQGKYILLLNPDTIVQEDTFQKLISFFEKTPDAGLAGCKVLNSDGTLQLACRRGFPGPWTSFTKVTGLSKLFPKSRLFARYNMTYLSENETYEVDAISGAFMMLKREVYEKVGGFDCQFFMYGEDLDLCYRIQKAGYKVYYVHDTQIIHYKGESTKRSSLDETRVFYEAMHLFVKKHFSSSFMVEIILRFAIIIRQLFASLNVYRLVALALVFDFLFFDLSLFAAAHLYQSPHWHGFPQDTILGIYTIPALIQILIASMTGAYKKDSISVLRVLYSIVLGFFILSSVTFFFKQYAYSRAVVLSTYAILLFMLPAWRIIFKLGFKLGLKEEIYKTRTLIVGTDRHSVDLAKKLKSKLTSIQKIAGLIGLNRKQVGEKIEGMDVLGSIDNIKKIIKEKKITEVIFASGEMSYNQMLAVVSECQGENVDFKVAGSELDYLVGKSSITMLDEIPLLEIFYNISTLTSKVTKRIFDFVLAIPALIFIYPFIYSFRKIGPNSSDFSRFVLGLPEVLSGKKSIVGPFRQRTDTDLYLGRSGLTGLWYTEGLDNTDRDESIKLDIFYARNQNIWLDLEILGKTFSKMFSGMEN
ncbi:MAG: glycosyltransferase [Ignavibacteria bacterium]|jgi:GT2 family glycosyltransferase|nr:glycosyltransferase [Ignavibacteria bacterium]MCU7499588.1 glycosyltransferase [Ignavibacteria bacterium]MCU7513025.1 glycosyltransferase [Ignavibacteria bacterium]MCU7519290.1 glycosyltransferase [Ignavibacteria bacterium]